MDIKPHSYTNNIINQKVLLVGVFPPPLGGIAVHLQRVARQLEAQGCKVWCWDVVASHYWRLVKFVLKKRPEVIIYHTMQLRRVPLELLLLLLASKLLDSKLVVVIHSSRFVSRMSWLNGKITSWLLRFCSQIVLVSEQLEGQLRPKITLLSNKISVESPFLPPRLAQRDAILSQTPCDLKQFLSRHSPIITVSITRLDLYQGQDLYGTDLAIKAFEQLLQELPNAGLLIVLGNANGQKLELGKSSYLLSECAYEMWPLIGLSDLFIRPTRSDCNAISVMEALYLHVPVVASDVCIRPAGVVLFRSGDASDLYEKMKAVLLR